MKNKLMMGLALPAAVIGFAAPAAAQTSTNQEWTGAVSTDWFDAANWLTYTTICNPACVGTVTNSIPVASDDYTSILLENWELSSAAPIIDGAAAFAGSVYIATDSGRQGWSLVIQNGGTLHSDYVSLGGGGGPHYALRGLVLVTGEGSAWTITDALDNSGEGPANLTISDGGAVSAASLYLYTSGGNSGDERSILFVTGAGSSWTSDTISLYFHSDLTIAESGVVNVADGVYLDGDSVMTIGAAVTATAPGTLNTPSVSFGAYLGGAGINFNHTSSDYTFAPSLIGGTPYSVETFTCCGGYTYDVTRGALIVFTAGVTHLTGDSSAYGGSAEVNGGSAYFDNLFGGDVSVNSGLVGGIGSIGSLRIESGAIVAPGNSIGTLSAGSASFAAGSIYQVEVNAAGQSDLLNVSGAVTISGGTVQVLAANGVYAPSTQYTIIQGGSVTGLFDGVSSNLAFLDPTLGYDAGQVYLTMTRNDIQFVDAAVTPNQVGVANAVDELGFGNPIWNAMVGQSDSGAQAAFNALSGEFHAGLDGGGFGDPLALFSIVQSRLSGMAEGPRAVQLASIGSTDGMAPNAERGSVWGQIFAAHGDVSGDTNAAGLDYTQSGLIVGADGRVGESGRLGAALSYQRTQASQDARRSDGDVSSYGISVYGGAQAGALSLSGEVGYSQREIDTTRRVLAGMVDETLSADYQAQAMHVQARVGYPIATEHGAIEPFASLAYVSVDTDGFTENGGSAALTRGDQSDSVTFATLGVRVMQEFGPNGRDGGLFGSLGLRHAEGDILPRSEMAFASNPGVSFSVDGAPIAENALALEGGIRWQLGENSSLTATYRGDIADDAQSHGASLRFAMAY